MNTIQSVDALEKRLTRLITAFDLRSDTNAVQMALSSPSRNWAWSWPQPELPYFIASTTKLYVTAILLQLRHEGLVDLDKSASSYLPQGMMEKTHVLNKEDFSNQITVRQLMAHTSGMADYFEQRGKKGRSHFENILKEDVAWNVHDVLDITRQLKPKFAPGTPKRAFYSDTNYQLLGAIIEFIESAPFSQVVHRRIIEPLKLTDTYLFTEKHITQYGDVSTMLFGKKPVVIPKAMASVQADGGLVSTASDGVRFLEGFMGGTLFPTSYFKEVLHKWHSIFGPLEYGTGVMRYKLPRIMSPFQPVPPMVGHSGASGTVLFFVPELDLYISGTLNQIKKRGLPFQLMTRVVVLCKKMFE